MTVRRILSLLLAALLSAALVPLSVKAAGSAARDAGLMALLSEAWEYLDKAEADAIASGADRSAVTLTVYRAALNSGLVDEGSQGSLTEKSFFFKVRGMACAYDYDARNYPSLERGRSLSLKETGDEEGDGILLVGPYYGQDASFTDRYANEAASVAEAAGGHTRILAGQDASGPNIARALTEARAAFIDSHGVQSADSTYICLTTGAGVTANDYLNGWAVNAGGAAYIDGRYIKNHAPYPIDDCFIWMSMCSGMHPSGEGTTGCALIESGAAGVYGYSRDVSFDGDYAFEANFWNSIKNGATVAEAFAKMTAEVGECDPFTSPNAWPVVMSPVDPFPQNPDSHQTVRCGWTLIKKETAISGWSLSETGAELYPGDELKLLFNGTPLGANAYILNWRSEDDGIASVTGNNKGALVVALSSGSTRILCDVLDLAGELLGTAYAEVNVLPVPDLGSALNVPGERLPFTTETEYPWKTVMVDGRTAAISGNAGVKDSSSSLYLKLRMASGDTLSFDWKVSSEPSDKLGFYVNGDLYGHTISGKKDWKNVVFTAETDGEYAFEWRYEKDRMADSGDDCGFVDNVSFSGTYSLPGDYDGDGEITAADALVILRMAMEIIDRPDWFDGDLDHDGSVTAADALIALRIAMGIIQPDR